MARQRGGGGRGRGGAEDGGGAAKRRGSRRGGRPPGKKPAATYYMQPAKRGAVVVLHRPVGNRVSPKVCGVMPSRNHGKALVDQLQRAESALHDLFYEATDDGIEALEAVLAACRDGVLKRMPPGENVLSMEEMAVESVRIQAELDARATQQRAVS
jgi:hypothetical protein